MEELEERLICDNVGSRCEVFAVDNRLLFVGKITYFEPPQCLQLADYRGNDVVPVDIGTSLKLRITGAQTKKHVLMMEGEVADISEKCYFIHVGHVIFKEEGRKNFRQSLAAQTIVAPLSNPMHEVDCTVVDFSATGIGIQCMAEYREGDMLLLKNIRFREDGVNYTLKCQVLRCRQLEDGRYFYGCQFENLPEQDEDNLFEDIFALQAEQLNAGKTGRGT